jgi:hypothetical protein
MSVWRESNRVFLSAKLHITCLAQLPCRKAHPGAAVITGGPVASKAGIKLAQGVCRAFVLRAAPWLFLR